MPVRNTQPTEPLEARWFLSTATEHAHPAPHPAPALHAPASATPTAESEPADGETAAPVAPTPTPAPSAETEDQANTTPAVSTNTPAVSTNTPAVTATTPPQLAAPSVPPAAPVMNVVLADLPSSTLLTTPQPPDTQVVAAIFNTRHPITPQDVALQSTLPTPISAASALTQAVTEVARSPLVIKSATDALLSLSRTDLLASFADAITSFAHESAAIPGDSLANFETHHYKWQITLGVLAADAFLIGHWYAIRRRATHATAAPPFSTRTL